MLRLDDLINIKYIPDETEISLLLFIDFYENYLCKRFFVFTLYNGEQVKLFFKDTTEIFHISGIEHIYKGIPMSAKKFVEEVKRGSIDLATLNRINHNAYIDFIDRIRSLACLDAIIKNCEYLSYPNGKITNSTIKVSYLLLKGLSGKNLHLGIDTYKADKPYFPKTLLVTEKNSLNKFIDSAEDRFRVSVLEILEKETSATIEIIKRKEAADTCKKIVVKAIEDWCEVELQQLIYRFYLEKFQKTKNQEWRILVLLIVSKSEAIIISEISRNLLSNKQIIDIVKEYKVANGNERGEWIELIIDEAELIIKDNFEWIKIIKGVVCKYLRDEGYKVIDSLVNQCFRRKLHPCLLKDIESQKSDFESVVKEYDPYWFDKVVNENIKSETERFANAKLEALTLELVNIDKDKFIDIFSINMLELVAEELYSKYASIVVERIKADLNGI